MDILLSHDSANPKISRGMLGVRPRWVIAILLTCAVVCVGRRGVAQVTAEQLIGRSVAEPNDARYKDVEEAIVSFYNGDVADASKSFAAATTKNPDLPPSNILLGQLFFASNQIASARAELEKAVSDHPDDPEAYLLFADLALRSERWTDAESLYFRGSNLCESYKGNDFRKRNLQISTHAGLTAIASRRSQWAAAEKHANAWLALDDKSVPAHTQLGRALFHQEKWQSSLAEFTTSHTLNPKSPRPEINMALLYEELVAKGDKAKRANARNAMQAGVDADPQNLATRIAVTRWALGTCEIEMAEANAKAALSIDKNSLDAKILVGLAARHRKDLATAEASFRSAHLQSPANFAVVTQLALVLIEQPEDEKKQQALEYAELNFRVNPDQSLQGGRDAAITLAWVFFRMGQRADSLNSIQAAINSGTIGDESAYLAAKVLSENGRTETATNLLQAVLRSGRCFPTQTDAEALLAKLTANGGGKK